MEKWYHQDFSTAFSQELFTQGIVLACQVADNPLKFNFDYVFLTPLNTLLLFEVQWPEIFVVYFIFIKQ